MKIVIKKAGYNPEVREINGELHEMQEIVGGYIECINVIDNILLVCNEEGKFMGLTPNFAFNGDLIVGDVFFVAAGEEDFESLTDEQTEFLMVTMNCFEK
jgi:hypothetical protein